MSLLRRGICAPHSSGEHFPTTYDADGNVCPSLTESDKVTVGVGALILIIIAAIWGINYTREKLSKEKDESCARASMQPMVKLDRKGYSPPGSQPSSRPSSQPSSESSHSDHAQYSIVEDYSAPERTRPEQFVPPRQPPAITRLEGSKQFVSPASTVISTPPPRSSSHSSLRLDQIPGQSLAQAGLQVVGAPPRQPPIKNPPLRINTARAQRSISPTYQAPRPASSLGPGRLPGSASSSSLHAFSPVSPMGAYPALSPAAPGHMAPSAIAPPVRAVAPSARVHPMVEPAAPATAASPPPAVTSFGQVSAPAAPAAPEGPAAASNATGPSGAVTGLAVAGPAIPAMLAQAPARSTSLDTRAAGPATPISPTIQTPSGAMQFPFSALSPPTSPSKQVPSPLRRESHEMDEYFDALSVDQIIRDVPQGQNVTAQYAPDVQGFSATHGYTSPIPSLSPERLPYLSPQASRSPSQSSQR